MCRARIWLLVATAVLTATILPAFAVQPDEMLSDSTLEGRARALSRELRCMVCQNQSIDDSEAPLARDLRLLVRDRLKAGDSDREVIDFVVARYGDFVLLNPRVTAHSIWLWAIPFGVLFSGGVLLIAILRRRTADTALRPLTVQERERVTALMDQGPNISREPK